jgi:hypothetical protein
MKLSDTIFLLILGGVIFLGVTPTHAALWGWSATASARNATNFYQQMVSGATRPDCEIAREAVVMRWQTAGFEILSEGSCQPVSISASLDVRDQKLVRWPWPGPICLTCPYLFEENIDVLFPVNPQRVRSLIEKYGIDAYNRALLDLQQQFDLESFEHELYLIENESPLN